ncbi:MAG: hypothetical protein AAGI23_02060 [Bacteroidota bacterium]
MSNFSVEQLPQIVDYNNETHSLAERAKAYLDLNCSHCHNPTAWEVPTEREFDFRYETPLHQSGISFEEEKIKQALLDEEMPFIGTTILDKEGVTLVVQYLESL